MSDAFGDALYRDVQAYGARPSHRTATDPELLAKVAEAAWSDVKNL